MFSFSNNVPNFRIRINYDPELTMYLPLHYGSFLESCWFPFISSLHSFRPSIRGSPLEGPSIWRFVSLPRAEFYRFLLFFPFFVCNVRPLFPRESQFRAVIKISRFHLSWHYPCTSQYSIISNENSILSLLNNSVINKESWNV